MLHTCELTLTPTRQITFMIKHKCLLRLKSILFTQTFNESFMRFRKVRKTMSQFCEKGFT